MKRKTNRTQKTSKQRSKSRFSYSKRSLASVRKRSHQSGSNRERIIKEQFTEFVPQEKNHIRILPPTWEEADHFSMDVFVNYQIGPDNSSFVSLSAMKQEPDPIAEERARAEKQGDLEYAEELKPRKRPTCYILDRDNPDEGVQVWPMPWTVDRDIASLMIHKRTGEVIPIDDPEEGYDVYFSRSGKGIKTKYHGIEIDRDSSPALDNEEELEELVEWLEENPLPEALNFSDYDHIKKVFNATPKTDDEDEDEDDNYTRKDIESMSRKKLESLVKFDLEDCDDLRDEMDDMEDDELVEAICRELGLFPIPSKKSSRQKRKHQGQNLDE